MFASRTRSFLLGLALAGAVLVFAGSASAQCFITGPDALCAGSAELCGGPDGDFFFFWTFPDGSESNEQCVVVNQTGTYTLRTFDFFTGQYSAPTTHDLAAGPTAPCLITGPATGCDGTPVELCGPDGALAWTWSGPNGFTAATRCVSVTASGTYSLQVGDPGNACVTATSCSHDVAFASCREPDPPSPSVNCPRPACFWERACRHAGTERYDAGQMATIAACVDDHASSFSWSSAYDGLCATLSSWHKPNVRKSAKRQFAAVLANVCAGQLHLTPRSGLAVGIDPSAALSLEGSPATVGAWISQTDAALQSLESASLDRLSVRKAYRAIIRSGWHIAHGHGVSGACNRGDRSHNSAVALNADDSDFEGDESLELALADDDFAMVEGLRPVGPNPFATEATLAYSIPSGDAQDVSIAVYDLTGRKLRELVNTRLQPGYYETRWDGRLTDGTPARNGVYFVIGTVGGHRIDSRLTLLR